MNLFKQIADNNNTNITPMDMFSLLQKQTPLLVLDVRQPEEYQDERIQGAKLIPLDQLDEHFAELPRDREIICVCRSGSRSAIAVRQLTKAGFKARNLTGGIMAWRKAGLPIERG